MEIPKFHNQAELFKFLKDNKDKLAALKMQATKYADAVAYRAPVDSEDSPAFKSEASGTDEVGKLTAELVINTTGLLDSHGDVHIKGLWKKSVRENKNLYLLKQHKQDYENVISDDVTAELKDLTWKELGFPKYPGTTEALVFNANISKGDTPFMYDQYKRGKVKNHSVGMRYVNLFLAINSEEKYYADEKKVWDKYIDGVANRADAEEQGYFWAVTEAKVIEGSAVLFGSNWATPTLSVTESKQEPETSTPSNTEPPLGTHKKSIYSFLNENYDK